MDSERINLCLGSSQGCLDDNLDKEKYTDTLNKRKEEVHAKNIY